MKADGQRGLREAVLCAALLCGLFSSVSCVRFEVKDSKNVTCILADLSVNFTVGYNSSKKLETAAFVLPANASVDLSSTCGNVTKNPLLAIKFGNGSLVSINFTHSEKTYQVDVLVFTYNLSDKALFPDAAENGTKEVSSKSSEISAKANFTYRCFSPHLITMGEVKLTLHDVRLEAYMSSSNYSKDESLCKEDIAPTSAPPVPPTTAPVKPQTPEVGEYRINGSTGAACLLARMGLQLNFTYINKTDKVATYEFNIEPKHVARSGECSNSSVTLKLSSAGLDLLFNFTQNTTATKFYLREVRINTSLIPDAKEPNFFGDNSSLSYLQTTAHKSFKCAAKQTFQITSNFSIVTYNLQIQAFDIDEDKFGPAVECTEDQNSMLVPIVVGAALAGLVLIVLIAYLIGRKRSHAGYQTI